MPRTRSALLIILLAFAVPALAALASDPPALPDSPQGACVRAYLDSFNSHDAERVRAFEQAHRA